MVFGDLRLLLGSSGRALGVAGASWTLSPGNEVRRSPPKAKKNVDQNMASILVFDVLDAFDVFHVF